MANLPRFYADLHCHPSMYAYNRMRHTELEQDESVYHLWHPQPEHVGHMKQGKRAADYWQAEPAKLVMGRCRLAMLSITPIEKSFLLPSAEIRREIFPELLKIAAGATLAKASAALLRGDKPAALSEALGLLKNDGLVRKGLIERVLLYDPRRIAHMMSEEFDYWEDFLAEVDFISRKDGEEVTVTSTSTGPVTGRYTLCASPEHLAIPELPSPHELLLVLTIEGAHTFTMDAHERRRPDDEIFARIDALKALDTPVFFLTLAHHFDNGICGHAHSMPDLVGALADQRPRMHEGFERQGDIGRRVVRRLLSLDDEALEDTGEQRILIDCKHMSARTRQEYYAEIIEPANAIMKKKRKPPLPVIFSHAAYSGVRSLDAMIRDADSEDDAWKIGPYYAWTLHCSDEDIRMILKTRGLFGLCFDQRVAGLSNNQKVHPAQLHHVLFQQILGVVDAIMLDDTIASREKIKIWDCLCLGTDFDGMIDPVSAYPTALSLDEFALDLRRSLEEIAHTRMIEKVGVDAIVDKIAYENIMAFTTRHLPRAFPGS